MNFFIYLTAGLVFFLPLTAIDKNQYELLTGLKGSYNEKENVFKATFPREDIKILIDRIPLDPFMGLTSWTAFTPVDNNIFILMGDLVLFQDEVNPVMSILLNNDIQVTALHNHFFYEKPKIYFMHIAGKGTLENLSRAIKNALNSIKEIRIKNKPSSKGFEEWHVSSNNSIDPSSLEKIFGIKGQAKEGMVKFVFGRSVEMDGITLSSEMGINTWAAFAGTNNNALVDGDIAVLENELQPVLKILRKGNINVVAIHNHMTMELPRMIFLHYWGKGKAADLAGTVKEALSHLSNNRVTK